MKRQFHVVQLLVLASVFFIGAFWFAPDVLAQAVETTGAGPTDFGLQAVEDTDLGLSSRNIITIVFQIIRVLLSLIGIIVLGLFLYAGYLWMTSAGQEDKITKAKSTMVNAVIGLAIIMSSVAIVSFVINALNDATGGPIVNTPRGESPVLLDFVGSGALGDAVLDHYPFRFAQDIPRNTKIAITFREAIDPATVIENTNNTCFSGADIVSCDDAGPNARPVYGDCLDVRPLDFARDCDTLIPGAIAITEADLIGATAVSGTVLAVYEDVQQTEIRTISIRPYDALGSSTNLVWYDVSLSRDVENLEGQSIFRNSRNPYSWEFQTNTTYDLSPPAVASVYPDGGSVAKNTIVQVTFDEPMDPIAVQGVINNGTNAFTNLIFGRTDVTGQWRSANGYRTVEFVPSTSCGDGVTNSCGEPMYCLPVTGCDIGDITCTNEYRSLIRTGVLVTDDLWEAIPFTGAYDMAGNSLDGNNDGLRDGAPTRPTDQLTLDTENELEPDNYSWTFTVANEIDRRIPYPHQITPGVDAQQVRGVEPIEILFSIPMHARTLYDVTIEEYPETDFEQPWTYPISGLGSLPVEFGSGAQGTALSLRHREFGPDNADLFYFITIPGTVRGINQNCLYPGYGPEGDVGREAQTCVYNEETGETTDCVDVSTNELSDTGCAFTPISGGDIDQSVESIEACIGVLKEAS